MVSPSIHSQLPLIWLRIWLRLAAIVLLSAASVGVAQSSAWGQSGQAEQPATPSNPPSTPTPSAGNRPVLQLGSQGAAVIELQALLNLLGYYAGPVDGAYQESTAQAVAAFQQAAGLPADGIVGLDTWNRLLPASTVAGSAPNPTPSSTPSPTPTPTPSPAAATPAPAPAPTPSSSGSFPSPTITPAPAPAAATPSPTPAPAPTPAPSPAPVNSEAASSTPATAATAEVDLPILRLGMQGPAVARLQERLQAIGFFDGAVDGVFGAETQAAVQAAQESFNLEPDGVVGPATWSALLQ